MKIGDRILDRISYSALQDYEDCGHFFKLKHLDRLYEYESTVDTIYGDILHNCLQAILMKQNTVEEAIDMFRDEWKKYYIENKQEFIDKGRDVKDMSVGAVNSILNVEEAFRKKYGDYEPIGAEIKLASDIPEFDLYFKGYVDLVIKTNKDNVYHVIDIKTSGSVFMFKKFLDTKKKYQVIFYKDFISKELEIDPKKIETTFCVCVKGKSKKPIEFIDITSGPKRVKNARAWMTKILEQAKKERFLKKRKNCHRFGRTCQFFNTKHCKF